MSEFSVNIPGLNTGVRKEELVTKDLTSIESDINSIISNLSISSAGAEDIKRRLKDSLSGVTDEKKKVEIMAKALDDISMLYDNTERKVINNLPGTSELAKAISSARDKIADWAKECGITIPGIYGADPVNLCNGNYVYDKVCLMLESDLDMQFRIFYNIQGRDIGTLGRGWIHTFEPHLVFEEDSARLVKDDASITVFAMLNGTYVSEKGGEEALTKTEDGYKVTAHGGISQFFDSFGRLTRKTDFEGHEIVLSYGDDGKLVSALDNHRQGFNFVYDENGNLSQVIDHTGRMISLTVSDDKLVCVTDAVGAPTNYNYDDEGRLTTIVNAKGTVCLKNEYDAQGRTVAQSFSDGGKMTFAYADDEGRVTLTEQNGNKIDYFHDDRFRNTKNVYYDGEESYTYDMYDNRDSYTDKNGNTFKYLYDDNGNVISLTNPNGDVVETEYTVCDQVTRVSVNGRLISLAKYDENHHQVETQTANGATDTYEYDEAGNMTVWHRADGSTACMEYDERGNMTSVTNSMGGITKYEYNNRNQVVKTVSPDGGVTEYAYDDNDNLVYTKDAAGNERRYVYDICGNLLKATDFDGSEVSYSYNSINKPESITDAEGGVTTFAYDKMWNISELIDPEGFKTTYEYDPLHRLSSVTDADGATTSLSYDPNGNLIKRIDPEGGVHVIGYDALNRANLVTDPTGVTTTAEYDDQSNVTKINYPDGTTEEYEYDEISNPVVYRDRAGYEQHYEYDVAGNLVKTTDKLGILEEFEYFPGGLLKSEKYADGSYKSYEYNSSEQVVRVYSSSGDWTISYDVLGRPISVNQEGGISESYEYDALGNITALVDGEGNRTVYGYNKAGFINSVIDGLGNETRYAYNKCGRLTDILQPQKKTIHYTLSPAGKILEVNEGSSFKETYEYDRCGRIIGKTENDGSKTVAVYNADGTVRSMSFADGKSVKYSYNALKQLTQMEDWLGITRVTSNAVGLPLKVENPDGTTVSYEWGYRGERRSVTYPDGKTAKYDYDDKLHLTESIFGDKSVKYSYDETGKLIKKLLPDGVKTSIGYNKAGQLAELSHFLGDECINKYSYEYDRTGRKSGITSFIKGETEELKKLTYSYNAVGSLVAVHQGSELVESYEYDAFANRMSSMIAGAKATYEYNDAGQLISMRDAEGTHTYSYDMRGNFAGEALNGNDIKKLTFNSLGLLEAVNTGKTSVKYGYNGFGNRISKETSGDVTVAYGYVYDYASEYDMLLNESFGTESVNYLWDAAPIGEESSSAKSFYLNNEMGTPVTKVSGGRVVDFTSYDSFGNIRGDRRVKRTIGFAGYRPDEDTGYNYVNAREYDSKLGRFLSRDPQPGYIITPLTLNKYGYCNQDPVNAYDPSGEILNWLAGGIVGAVVNVVGKVAGDAVKSVKAGKLQFSSWESYVGTAAGGFTEGSLIACGVPPVAASAAGGAVENFTTGGLSMLAKEEGYRAEDGYSLWVDIAAGAAGGAISGAIGLGLDKLGKAVKGKVSKIVSKKSIKLGKFIKNGIQIKGLNAGRGNMESVWKGLMTKSKKGLIKDISWKSIGKGILSESFKKVKDEFKDGLVDLVKDPLKKSIFAAATSAIGLDKTTADNWNRALKYFWKGDAGRAACPTEAADLST